MDQTNFWAPTLRGWCGCEIFSDLNQTSHTCSGDQTAIPKLSHLGSDHSEVFEGQLVHPNIYIYIYIYIVRLCFVQRITFPDCACQRMREDCWCLYLTLGRSKNLLHGKVDTLHSPLHSKVTSLLFSARKYHLCSELIF